MSTPTISGLEQEFGEQQPTDLNTSTAASTNPIVNPLGLSTDPNQMSDLDQYEAQQALAAQQQRDEQLAGTTQTDFGVPVVSGGSAVGRKIVEAAEHYLGIPYKWGGSGPGGVDCSGLVQLAYKAAGISIPRISFQQADAGTRVSQKALRPGDLVAWDNSSRNDGADHIAIYIGNGQIIEAPHPGAKVRIRRLGADEGAFFVRMGWS